MSFFRNKHVITAMIVAPVLAIIAWYLVDMAVAEKPSPAVAGQAYPLVAKSNCRYTSGDCDLVNAEFRSRLQVSEDDRGRFLTLHSNHALQSAVVGFATADGIETKPVAMRSTAADKHTWQTRLPVAPDETTVLRLALTVDQAHYFAETTMAFSQYETSFNKDFRK